MADTLGDDDPEKNPIGPAVREILLRKARRLVGRAGLRRQDEEDVTQELTLRLLERLDRYDPARGTWPAFARCVIERLGNNLTRDRRAAKRDGGQHAPLPGEVPAPAGGDAGDLARDVAGVLAGLPDDLRRAAELVMIGTVAEAARALGVSTSTVYARLRELRARTEFAALADYL